MGKKNFTMNPDTGILDSVTSNLLSRDHGDTREPPAQELSPPTSASSWDGRMDEVLDSADMIMFNYSANCVCVHRGIYCERPHHGATTPGTPGMDDRWGRVYNGRIGYHLFSGFRYVVLGNGNANPWVGHNMMDQRARSAFGLRLPSRPRPYARTSWDVGDS